MLALKLMVKSKNRNNRIQNKGAPRKSSPKQWVCLFFFLSLSFSLLSLPKIIFHSIFIFKSKQQSDCCFDFFYSGYSWGFRAEFPPSTPAKSLKYVFFSMILWQYTIALHSNSFSGEKIQKIKKKKKSKVRCE